MSSAYNAVGKRCFVTHLIFNSAESDSTSQMRLRFQPSFSLYYFIFSIKPNSLYVKPYLAINQFLILGFY